METLIITRIVFGILLLPFLMIVGAVFAVVAAFYALTINPLLALLVIVACAGIFVFFVRWETARVRRNLPPEDLD